MHASDVLAQWHIAEDIAWAVGQVVSELVTNAVTADPNGPVSRLVGLVLHLAGPRLTVEVLDSVPALPQPRPASDDDESGRGLHIVTTLATALKVSIIPGGKSVAATFDLPPRRVHSHQ